MNNPSNEMANDRRAVVSWCLYDWANSAFTTLVVTFIYATYFSKAFAENEDIGTSLWSQGIVVSSVLIALLSPLFGAMADRGGMRRRFLFISTLVCVIPTAALTFITPSTAPERAYLALALFVVGNVAFEMGMVFYNSFLPVVAAPERIGRVSGFGWAAGYGGGLVCLVVALLGFVGLGDTAPWLPLPQEDGFHVRATNLLVAGWFLLFSLPMFLFVRDVALPTKVRLRDAVEDLRATVGHLRRYREVVRFLFARLIYNDGLVTIFAFGGIYAAGTFGMEFGEVIVFGIALNVAAGFGAWVFGYFDDKLGGKATVMVSLVALAGASLLAVLAPTKQWFWVAGILVGIFAGPNQSASRSLMGRFVPERHRSEFFGFFAFSGKATAFLGPLLLGILSRGFGQRAGVSVVLLFFIVGGLLLFGVNEKRGIEAAQAG
jgi:UMF1 family MFS transporter